MGKAIGSLDKHKIYAGTLNEGPIKQRTKLLKDAWNKSVKERKEVKPASAGTKREVVAATSQPVKKKAKTEMSSFSSLLKKVNPIAPPKLAAALKKAEESSKSESQAGQVTEIANKSKLFFVRVDFSCHAPLADLLFRFAVPSAIAGPSNKTKKRGVRGVKWVDHFGGKGLVEYSDGSGAETKAEGAEPSDLSDRRKRDRQREKELLAKAK